MRNEDYPLVSSFALMADAMPKTVDELIEDAGGKAGHNSQMVRDLAVHAAQEAVRTMARIANDPRHECCDGFSCLVLAHRAVELSLCALTDDMREQLLKNAGPEAIRDIIEKIARETGAEVKVMSLDEAMAEMQRGREGKEPN